MKKILTLLLMVSVVAGMTLPAMATDEASHGVSAGSSSNGGTNGQDFDTAVTGSNYAAHTVNVALTVEPQTNIVGKQVGVSGDNVNGAVADFDAAALAGDATSGAANGGAGSGTAVSGGAGASNDKVKVGEDNEGDVNANPEAETGKAVSVADGYAKSGKALSIAKVADNDNIAKANDNELTSGNVDNNIDQTNVVKQITPIDINADQKLIQKVKVFGIQDASSNPVTIAKQKTTDIDLEDFEIEL